MSLAFGIGGLMTVEVVDVWVLRGFYHFSVEGGE